VTPGGDSKEVTPRVTRWVTTADYLRLPITTKYRFTPPSIFA